MNRLIRILGILTIGYLLILSILGTYMVQSVSEGESGAAYYLNDTWYLHVLVIGACVLLLRQIHRGLQTPNRGTVRRALLVAVMIDLIVGLAMIYCMQLEPSSDGAKVMQVAKDILAGNLDAFGPSGYMYRYPFQRGLVLLDLVCILLFGDGAFLALQTLNLLALILILTCMVWLVERIWQSIEISILTVILHLLFLPLLLYITHNYGILYGIAFSLLAICLAYHAWTTHRYGYYILAALSMALAVELKSNSLIWYIGLAMALLFNAIGVWHSERRHAQMGILAIIVILAFVKMASYGSGAAMESLTGIEPSKGMPKTCWIYMGLQDHSVSPGAYNGNSVALFEECDYDYDTANEEAIHRIIGLGGYMAHNPGKTVRQFARKIAYEWNDPTYDSLSILVDRESTNSAYVDSVFAHSLANGMVHHVLVQYMNLYQPVILAFAFIAMLALMRRPRVEWWEIVLLTIYLGGFAFHLFWEAKPQYTLPYYVLLIPYAAYGMGRIAGYTHE